MEKGLIKKYLNEETLIERSTANRLTYGEVAELLGRKIVETHYYLEPEMTNRVGYQGSCAGDDFIEWSTEVRLDYSEIQGNKIDLLPVGGASLIKYYWTNQEDEQAVKDSGDSDMWNHKPFGYEII